jgi:hypothetical protein
MKHDDDIPTTDTTEIKRLIERVKQGKLDQGDAQLIEKLLNFLLTIVSLFQRKHTSIRRMKDLLFGMNEKKRGKDEAKNGAEESRSGAEESSQTDSPKESASSPTCDGDSSTQEVKSLKRPGHGRKAASDYPGARLVRLNHPEMAPGDPCPESGCEGHLHQLEQPNVKIYLMGQPLISATIYERPVLQSRLSFATRSNASCTRRPLTVSRSRGVASLMCVAISVAFCSTRRCSGSARRGRRGCESCPLLQSQRSFASSLSRRTTSEALRISVSLRPAPIVVAIARNRALNAR